MDAAGNAYVTGDTTSSNFPTTPGAYDTTYNSGGDVFVAKLALDTTPPVLTVPGDMTVEATGPGGATVSFTATATDDHDPAQVVTAVPPSGSMFPLGTTNVLVTATDTAGNSTTGTFNVTVRDTTPPVISGVPSNMTVEATGPSGEVVTWPAPTASDLVDGVVAVTVSPPSGSIFPLGITAVNLTTQDSRGNISTASFQVTVRDTTPPVLSLPPNQRFPTTNNWGVVVHFSEATASDLVSTPTIAYYVGGYPISNDSLFAMGVTTITVVATDAAGNSSSGQFQVEVRMLYNSWQRSFVGSGSDSLYSLQPTSNGPYLLGGFSSSTAGSGNKTSTHYGSGDYWVMRLDPDGNQLWEQSFGGTGEDSLYTFQQTSADGFILGGYSGSLPSGNKASANYGGTDYWVVGLDIGGNKLWEQSFGGSSDDYLYSFQQTSDGGLMLGGYSESALGTGNKTSPNYGGSDYWVIKLALDTTPPVLTVPDDMTVEATGPGGATVSFTATATDNADPSPVVTATPPSGSLFPLGTTSVLVTATDASANSTTGTFQVTVQDTTPPVISGVPSNITVEATGSSGAVVTWPAPTASDLVDATVVVTALPPSGSTFPLGITVVSLSTQDSRGNTSTASFQVTVQDTTPPVISGVPSNMTIEATGPTGAVVTWPAPTGTDLVDGTVAVTVLPPSGSTFPLGITAVNLTTQDSRGNTSTASFQVTVRDTTPPTIAAPADRYVAADGSGQFVLPDLTGEVVASDTVSSVTVTQLLPPGTVLGLGPHSVTFRATDAAGNSSTAATTVTVVNPPPPLSAPGG